MEWQAHVSMKHGLIFRDGRTQGFSWKFSKAKTWLQHQAFSIHPPKCRMLLSFQHRGSFPVKTAACPYTQTSTRQFSSAEATNKTWYLPLSNLRTFPILNKLAHFTLYRDITLLLPVMGVLVCYCFGGFSLLFGGGVFWVGLFVLLVVFGFFPKECTRLLNSGTRLAWYLLSWGTKQWAEPTAPVCASCFPRQGDITQALPTLRDWLWSRSSAARTKASFLLCPVYTGHSAASLSWRQSSLLWFC